MPRILIIAIASLFSGAVCGQDKPISFKDSVLLNKFWKEMKVAVNTKDKDKLATLCSFPFSCRPCLDGTTVKAKEGDEYVTVTKTLLYKSQYKLFFGKKFKETIDGAPFFFQAYDENHKPYGFSFFYVIVAPSPSWEGMQGFVYLKKVNGQYKIVAIDTVP